MEEAVKYAIRKNGGRTQRGRSGEGRSTKNVGDPIRKKLNVRFGMTAKNAMRKNWKRT